MSDRHGPHVLCCDGSGCDKARAPQTLWCDDHQPPGTHGIHYQAHSAPPWLADAAEALGRVRPSDGAPLALNWNQVLQEIRDLRDERDGWKANCESWRMVYNAWQDWSSDLLDELGRQPLHGSHGDGPAREVIAQLASMAPGVPRCLNCGCFSTVHEVDDEELRECTGCECTAFEAP